MNDNKNLENWSEHEFIYTCPIDKVEAKMKGYVYDQIAMFTTCTHCDHEFNIPLEEFRS